MEDRIIAVALPWHDGPRAAYMGGEATPLHPASVLQPCGDCGQVLAVGPGTALALAADPSIDLCCPACGVVRCRDAALVVEITIDPNEPRH